MTQPVKRLLYLVHGAPSFYQEAAFSRLSLWRQPGGSEFEIVVVTDDTAPLQALIGDPPQLRYLVFADEQRGDWQGGIGYIHRMKPNAFAWAIEQLDNTLDPVWAFVDSDTAFTRPPDDWFAAAAQGAVVLHAQEGTVDGNRSHSRSQRRLADACAKQAMTVRGKFRRISGASVLWNSGVIGLRASQRETVALIDTMYPSIPIHTIEQVALSIILQDRQQAVQTCEEGVLHYPPSRSSAGTWRVSSTITRVPRWASCCRPGLKSIRCSASFPSRNSMPCPNGGASCGGILVEAGGHCRCPGSQTQRVQARTRVPAE